MTATSSSNEPLDTAALCGHRSGPYRAFNPVNRAQIWQWCSAMDDRNPLYLDDVYRKHAGFDRVVAPPAMMQMWTMRDINGAHAPGTVALAGPTVFEVLREHGYPDIVAVNYDITFHRLLQEGDCAQHYSTIVSITPLKKTALGSGYFVTDRAEYLDQDNQPFAQALITYFVYQSAAAPAAGQTTAPAAAAPVSHSTTWRSDFSDVKAATLHEGQALPELAIPITHRLIVAGALATQDFEDVHHELPAALAAGMPDIFMNILTTSGLCARYLSDWAGPGSRLQHISFKLMAPNTPGDTMVMQGRVTKVDASASAPTVSVDFAGINRRGTHVSGNATLALAG